MLKLIDVRDIVASKANGGSVESRRQCAAEWCKIWLDFIHLQINKGCVVFDIDDTLVDDNESKIRSIQGVYMHCIKCNIPVFLITARPDGRKNRSLTKDMLEGHNIVDYKRLYMMPQCLEQTWENISKFKFSARQHISKYNFIIQCFGDMWTDHLLFPVRKQEHKELMKKTKDEDCVVFFYNRTCYIKLPQSS